MAATLIATKGEMLQFKTHDNIILNGFLAGPKNAKLCIIYVHEWGGNFYDTPAIELVREMSKRGMAIFSINTRGHDKVTHLTKITGKKITRFEGGVEMERFEDSVLDIDAAIHSLSKFGFKKFVLCGHSTGCQKVTYYQFKKNNKNVTGLVLVSTGDDYNQWKESILGKKFNETVRIAKRLVKEGKGYQLNFTHGDSPQRFLSVADLNNIEARLFNYDGEMKEFSKIKIPILALFGSKESSAKRRLKVMKVLKEKSNSRMFESHIVEGAVHRYYGCEAKAANVIENFISRLSEK